MEIAIIDTNTLACMGLQHILEDIIPVAAITVFPSYEELLVSHPERFRHFFVSSGIYFEHAQFFIEHPHRSIVLVNGNNHPRLSGLLTLNISQSEKHLTKDILSLYSQGRQQHAMSSEISQLPHHAPCEEMVQLLSQRENEVAVLLAKGYINKEIAERLSISLNTVISHRKNIMDKLHARSLADIITYVVTHGLAKIEEL